MKFLNLMILSNGTTQRWPQDVVLPSGVYICAKQLRVAPLQFTMKDGAMMLRQDARARPVRVSPLSVLAEFSTVSQRFDEQAGGLVVKTNAETGTFLEKAFTDPSSFYQDWEKKLEEVDRVIRLRGTS